MQAMGCRGGCGTSWSWCRTDLTPPPTGDPVIDQLAKVETDAYLYGSLVEAVRDHVQECAPLARWLHAHMPTVLGEDILTHALTAPVSVAAAAG